MADEIVTSDSEATPPPVLPPRGGPGIVIFALLLMVVVLAVAWLMIGRHRADLRRADVVELGDNSAR